MHVGVLEAEATVIRFVSSLARGAYRRRARTAHRRTLLRLGRRLVRERPSHVETNLAHGSGCASGRWSGSRRSDARLRSSTRGASMRCPTFPHRSTRTRWRGSWCRALRTLGIDAADFSVHTVHYYRRKDILDAPAGRTSAARYDVRHVWQAAGARLAGHLGLVTLAEARSMMRGADERALVAFVAARVVDARARAAPSQGVRHARASASGRVSCSAGFSRARRGPTHAHVPRCVSALDHPAGRRRVVRFAGGHPAHHSRCVRAAARARAGGGAARSAHADLLERASA